MATEKIRIEGARELEKTLMTFGPKIYRKVMRQAVEAGSKPVIDATKQALSAEPERPGWKRTGLTKKSIGRRVKTYSNSQSVISVIGPRVGFSAVIATNGKLIRDKQVIGEARKVNRLANARVVKIHDPAKIAHLVERGHGGPHKAGPHPFLIPSFRSSIGNATNAMSKKISDGIEREAAKEAK